MPRSPTLAEDTWFGLADELSQRGAEPTVRALAALGRERFGVKASFTTIQVLLDSWRRLGGNARVATDSSSLAATIQKCAEPLYRELLEDARMRYEPLLITAEQKLKEAATDLENKTTQIQLREAELEAMQRNADELRRELGKSVDLARVAQESVIKAHQQMETLRAVNKRLEEELDNASKRWTEVREDYQSRLRALESHNALLMKAHSEEDHRYQNLLTTIERIRERA